MNVNLQLFWVRFSYKSVKRYVTMKVTVVLWFPDWSSRHFRVIEINSSTAEYQCPLLPFWNIVNLKSSVKLWLPIVPVGILLVIHVCYTDVGEAWWRNYYCTLLWMEVIRCFISRVMSNSLCLFPLGCINGNHQV